MQEITRGRKYYILTTLFFTGAAVMVLELLGTRVLGPYYGVSLYVWSSLITVALVSLSMGYWLGGRMADRDIMVVEEGKKGKGNKGLATSHPGGRLYLLVLGAGLATLVIPYASTPVLKATSGMGMRTGSLASATVLFTVPMVLLGMVTPYAIKMMAGSLKIVGATAGNLFSISTIGSFAGSILTGFFLIPNIGTKMIIYVQALVLVSLWIVWEVYNRKSSMPQEVLIN